MIEFFLGRVTCYGWIPEWPKGTDCKSAANCFGGSNPPPSIRWCGGIGRRKGLKIPRWQHRAGSSPATSSSGKRSIEGYFVFFCFEGGCAEGRELERFGVDCNGCMTVSTYEKALKGHLHIPKQAPKRPECACFLGNDIGAYHTCGHLCRYCYANDNAVLVRENRKHHNPNSPFLIGESRPEDVIHQAKQEQWLDTQMSLFDYIL